VHDHLDEGDCAYTYVLEVMGIFAPWLFVVDLLLAVIGVIIEGISYRIDKLNLVVELCLVQ